MYARLQGWMVPADITEFIRKSHSHHCIVRHVVNDSILLMLIHEPGTTYQYNVRPYKVPCLWKLLCINRTSAGSTLVYSILKRFSLVSEVKKSKDLHVDILANTIHTCNIHIVLKITRSTYLVLYVTTSANTNRNASFLLRAN